MDGAYKFRKQKTLTQKSSWGNLGGSRTPGAQFPIKNASYEAYGYQDYGRGVAPEANASSYRNSTAAHMRSNSHETPRRFEGGECVLTKTNGSSTRRSLKEQETVEGEVELSDFRDPYHLRS